MTLHRSTYEKVVAAQAVAASTALALPSPSGLGDLLVRSEASGSSLIEGYAPTPRAVALADFAERGKRSAVTVARNVRAVRASLAEPLGPSWTGHVARLHAVLAPGHAGTRTVPVWIGGATPLDARYNAPPARLVDELLVNLDAFLDAGEHRPVIAAAIAHAQYESIHPYTDGNGRAGRVLIALVLAHYGLTPGFVLPVSASLFADRERYYAALTAYRAGRLDPIVAVVADAVLDAAEATTHLARTVAHWQEDARAALLAYQAATSPTGRVRRGVANALIDTLPATPVLDAATLAQTAHVTPQAARTALNALVTAGVLTSDKKTDRTRTLYVAEDLLDLIAYTAPRGRQFYDVEPGEPAEPLLAGPDAEFRDVLDPLACGTWLPRARRPCSRPRGHAGQHR